MFAKLAMVSLTLAAICGVIGFSGWIVTFATAAQTLFYLFLLLFVVLLIGGMLWVRKPDMPPPP